MYAGGGTESPAGVAFLFLCLSHLDSACVKLLLCGTTSFKCRILEPSIGHLATHNQDGYR
jgi:hypothetical protein